MSSKYQSRIAYQSTLLDTQLRFLKFAHTLMLDQSGSSIDYPRSLRYLKRVEDVPKVKGNIRKVVKCLHKTIESGFPEFPCYTESKFRSLFPSLTEGNIEYYDNFGWNTLIALRNLQKLTISLNDACDDSFDFLDLKPICRMKNIKIVIIQLDPPSNLNLQRTLDSINAIDSYPKTFLGFVLRLENRVFYESFSAETSFQNIKAIHIGKGQSLEFWESTLKNPTCFKSLEFLSIQINYESSFIKSIEKLTNLKKISLRLSLPNSQSVITFLLNFVPTPQLESLDLKSNDLSWSGILSENHDTTILNHFISVWKQAKNLTDLNLSFEESYFLNFVIPNVIKQIPILRNLTITSRTREFDIGTFFNQFSESNSRLSSLICTCPKFSLEKLNADLIQFTGIKEMRLKGSINKLDPLDNFVKMLDRKGDSKFICEKLKVEGYEQLLILKNIILKLKDIDAKLEFTCEEITREEFFEFVMSLLEEMECQQKLSLRISAGFVFYEEFDQIATLFGKQASLQDLTIIGINKSLRYKRLQAPCIIYN